MSFRAAIERWFDADLLLGRKPDPSPGEEGNPLLETGTAYFFLSTLGEASVLDVERFNRAVVQFEIEPGLPNKKPRSTELVTFDDLIGLCAGAAALEKLGCRLHKEVCYYGMTHGWRFSNNGDNTYTSHTKPWHRAFYLMSAGFKPGLWDSVFLALSIAVNAYFGMDDASGKRLNYLMIKTITGKSVICDLAIFLWWARIKKIYGGAKRIFIMYHGEKHPFSLHCPD